MGLGSARAAILAAVGLLAAAMLLSASLVVLDASGQRVSRSTVDVRDGELVTVSTVAASAGDVVVYDAGNAAPETFATVRFLLVPGGQGAAVLQGREPSTILVQRQIGPGDTCCAPALKVRVPAGVDAIDIVKVASYADARRPAAGDARVWFDRFIRSAAGDVGGTPTVYPSAAVLSHYALATAGGLAALGGLAAAFWALRTRAVEDAGGPREAGLALIARARDQVRALRAVALVTLASLVVGGLVMVPAAGALGDGIGGVGFANWIAFALLVAWVGILVAWSLFAWRAHASARGWTDALADAPAAP